MIEARVLVARQEASAEQRERRCAVLRDAQLRRLVAARQPARALEHGQSRGICVLDVVAAPVHAQAQHGLLKRLAPSIYLQCWLLAS